MFVQLHRSGAGLCTVAVSTPASVIRAAEAAGICVRIERLCADAWHFLQLQTLKLDGQMRELAANLKDEPSMLVFGRGQNYATALETALKVCG
jgi:fructoselysine-6-P-deglycase FrlB-like protein